MFRVVATQYASALVTSPTARFLVSLKVRRAWHRSSRELAAPTGLTRVSDQPVSVPPAGDGDVATGAREVVEITRKDGPLLRLISGSLASLSQVRAISPPVEERAPRRSIQNNS